MFDDSKLFSRPTSTVLGGKQTATLKTNVSDEVHERFQAYARERGYQSDSDCLRELILVALFGVEAMADLHRRRIESLGQNRTSTGLETQL